MNRESLPPHGVVVTEARMFLDFSFDVATRIREPIRRAQSLHVWPLANQMDSFFACLATRSLPSIVLIFISLPS